PPEIAVHDRPLVQGLDPRLYLTLVAHHDDVEMVRVDVFSRHALHVGAGDGVDPVHVVVVVVERQTEGEELAEPRCGAARGLEVPREAEREIRLGLGELGRRHRLVADPAQLLQKLDEGAVGLGRHDRRERHKCAVEPAWRELREGAVGVAMGLPQVLIQARGEGAAHDGVQDLEREPIGGRARRPRMPDPHHRLRRPRLVDQVHGAGRGPWWRGPGSGCPYGCPRPYTIAGKAMLATVTGSSRCCTSCAARSSRCRAISESAKLGRSTTSASRSSAASSRRRGTWIDALAPSKVAPVPSWAPRNAASSATSRALRAPAPCCSIVAVNVASPGAVDGSRAAPASTSSCTSTTGTLCISTTASVRPLGSVVVWTA